MPNTQMTQWCLTHSEGKIDTYGNIHLLYASEIKQIGVFETSRVSSSVTISLLWTPLRFTC